MRWNQREQFSHPQSTGKLMENLCKTRQALLRTGREGSSSTGSPPHPSPRPPLSQPHTPSQVLHAHHLVETSVDRYNFINTAMLYLFDGYVLVTFLFPCKFFNLKNMCKLNKSEKINFFVNNYAKLTYIIDPYSELK